MHRTKSLALGVLAIAFLVAGAAAADWVHVADSFFIAEEGEKSHPETLVRTIVIPGEVSEEEEEVEAEAGGRSFICLAYANNSVNARAGRIVNKVSIFKAKQLEEADPEPKKQIRMDGRVRKNKWSKCEGTQQVRPGDMVVFETTFKSFKSFKLASYDKGMNMVMTVGDQQMSADELLRIGEEANESGGGGNPGGGDSGGGAAPPPGGGGGGSAPPAGDEFGAASQVIDTNKAQLVRPSGGSPGFWAIFCEFTRVKPGTRIADPATYGFGPTIAVALAQTIQKTGCGFSPPRSLSGAEQNAVRRYGSLNAGDGPTAIRRDGGGGFHAEWYRTFQGQSNHTGVPNFASGVDVVCKNSRPVC